MESRTYFKLMAKFYMVQEVPDFRAAKQMQRPGNDQNVVWET